MVKFGNVDVDISDIGIEYNTLRVIKSRNSFIREWIEKGAKFIGKVDKDDIKEDGLKRMTKNITGDELWIEYFLFEDIDFCLHNNFFLNYLKSNCFG